MTGNLLDEPLTVPAPPTFDLTIPPPRALTLKEELQLLRQAWSRNPGSPELRYAFASMLVRQDEFDEACALLRDWAVDDFHFLTLEMDALLSYETPAANRRVYELCVRALEIAQGPQRVAALSNLAKSLIRLDRRDEARDCLQQALALDEHERNAYKRMAALDLHQKQPDRVLALAEGAVDRGVLHSRVVASESVALAQLGMIAEAQASQGLDRFLRELTPEPPEGWDTLEAFNAELAQEMSTHPDTRFGRYGTASEQTWRIDEPSLRRSRVFPALQSLIRREVMRYVAGLPEGGHAFLQARPQRAALRNWCVLTEGDGHETWHVHQNGWLSGTYYVYVPDHISQGHGKGGCIAFGLPEDVVGESNAAAFGERLVRPRSGLMLMFPSHAFHRTYPHGGSGRRICCAFDIIAPDSDR